MATEDKIIGQWRFTILSSPKVMAIQQARIQKRLDEQNVKDAKDAKRLAKKDAAVERELEVYRLGATQVDEATAMVMPTGSQTTTTIG